MKREIPTALVLASLMAPALAGGAARSDAQGPAERVTICHKTSSQRNPVVVITVSGSALQTHLDQHGDDLMVNGVCGWSGGGGS